MQFKWSRPIKVAASRRQRWRALRHSETPQRLQILFVLAETERDQQRHRHPLPFSELHDAVDIDSSSQFPYHLDQLIGQFVSQTPDGYCLTYSGRKLIRSILSGVYESASKFDERCVDGTCLYCGEAPLRATLDREEFMIQCESCGATLLTDSFPQSQLRNRTPREIVESFGYRIWSSYMHLRESICPECYGRAEIVIVSHALGEQTRYTYRCLCSNCGFTVHLPVEVAVAFHPATVGLFWNHEVSLFDVPPLGTVRIHRGRRLRHR
ncbi:DUF7351 domain-containing protein [Halosimplex aquaticum]